jgi:hypothetical protein
MKHRPSGTVSVEDMALFTVQNKPSTKKGAIMKVQDYCKAMQAEVSAWKEKLEAMKKVTDSYGTEQKEKILPLVGQLEQEVTSAQMRVQQLETECPSDWSPMKNEIDDLFGTIGSSVDRAWRDLSPGEVGG